MLRLTRSVESNMNNWELPNSAVDYCNQIKFKSTVGDCPTFALLGASGVLGQVTARGFYKKMSIVGFDVRPNPNPDIFDRWVQGNAADKTAIQDAVKDAEYVLQLFSGSGLGWDAIVSAEIQGTKNTLEACVEHGVRRLILVTSNHVTGMNEVEYYAKQSGELEKAHTTSMPRPDGLYSAGKLFSEGLARSSCELQGLPISVLRLGAMRLIDDPSQADNGPRFPNQAESSYLKRMNSVWLSHEKWIEVIEEEVHSTDAFRLRYLPGDSPDAPWTGEIYKWNPKTA